MPIISFKYKKPILILVALLLILITFICNLKLIGRVIYPIKYTEYISKYSKINGIDPRLVASIIMVESKYDKYARSHKDARGLMQISPITGNWASQEIGIDDFDINLLYDPEINIKIGCWYINKLNKQFNYDINLVLAAYNAGSGNVTKWLNDEKYSSDGSTLENIPFKETREYIKKITKYYNIYKKIYEYDYFY